MISLLVFGFLISLSAFGMAAECPLNMGGIKLEYSVATDNNEWQGKYGFYNVYQWKQNAFGNKNIQIQLPGAKITYHLRKGEQQQQQQVNNANNFIDTTTKAPEPEEEPLPIWYLTVPRTARNVQIYPINDEKLGEKISLGETEYANPNITTFGVDKDFTIKFDITQFELIDDHWYLICAEHSVVQENKLSTCNQCNLLKACTKGLTTYSNCYRHAFTILTPKNYESSNSATIQYLVRDLPFKSANVTTNVLISPKDPRCASEIQKNAQKKISALFPNSMTIVKIDLSPQFRYEIQTDLMLPIELPGLESSTIRNYVGFEDFALIEACNDRAEV